MGEDRVTVGRWRVLDGEAPHLRWVLAHPTCAARWVKAATTFVSPETEGVPVYQCTCKLGGAALSFLGIAGRMEGGEQESPFSVGT
jgi:hypothetical protein